MYLHGLMGWGEESGPRGLSPGRATAFDHDIIDMEICPVKYTRSWFVRVQNKFRVHRQTLHLW